MYKKLILLMCFVLVLGSASSVSMAVDWTDAAKDRSWINPLNWDTGAVPTTGDNVTIGSAVGDACQPILITNAGTIGAVSGVALGIAAAFDSNATLTVNNGGYLTTDGSGGDAAGGMFMAQWSLGGVRGIYIQKGTTPTSSIVRLRNGATWSDADGWNESTAQWGLWAGCYRNNEAHVYMDGGTFKVQNGGWEIARGDDSGGWNPGHGFAYLRGGIVDINGYVTIRSMRPCTLSTQGCDPYMLPDNWNGHEAGAGGIDINSVNSAIIITGNKGVKKMGATPTDPGVSQSILDQFQAYIDAGFLTAWGRSSDGKTGSQVAYAATNWPKVSDPKAEIQMDYDVRNAGRTTIMAYLAKSYEANKPSPKTYTTSQPVHLTLMWTSGLGVAAYTTGPAGKGHHVFFDSRKSYVTGAGTNYPLGTQFGHYRSTTNSFDPNKCIIDNAGTYGRVVGCDVSGNLLLATTFYWRVMEVNGTDNNGYKGQVWQFATLAGTAQNPVPKNNAIVEIPPIATGGSVSTTLTWTAGFYARKTLGHDVYIGTVLADVTSATPAAPSGVYKGRQNAASYLGTNLSMGKPTYWRIDEINDYNLPAKWWKGTIWSFTIPNYVLIDNFSSYGTNADLWAKWIDGHTGVAGYRCTLNCGSRISLLTAQMQYSYANDGSYSGQTLWSEIARSYPSGVDFRTGGGAPGTEALSMTYKGAADNNTNVPYDRMYVILRDTDADTGGHEALVNNWDPNAAKVTSGEWDIDLDDFTGLTVAGKMPIKRMLLGFGVPLHHFGDPGGTGVVIFDNMRIYQPRCVGLYHYRALPGDIYIKAGEFASNGCKVDMNDLRVLSAQQSLGDRNALGKKPINNRGAGDWLRSDHWTDAVPANDPCDASLIAYWKCNDGLANHGHTPTTVHDFSGNGHEGQFGELPGADSNDPNEWVIDNDSNHPHKMVLDFNDKQFVTCGNGVWSNLENHDFTLCTWVKMRERTAAGWECFVAKGERAWKLQMLFGVTNGALHFAYPRGGDGGSYKLNTGPGKWYHITGVWHSDPSQLRACLYLNGLLDSAVIASLTTAAASDCNVILGAKDNEQLYQEPNGFKNRNVPIPNCPTYDANSAKIHFLKGRLDDVRIYNRVLNEGEIMRLARTANPKFVTGYKLHYNSPSSSIAYGTGSEAAVSGRYASDLQPWVPDGKVDFKDFAIMAEGWLESVNWP